MSIFKGPELNKKLEHLDPADLTEITKEAGWEADKWMKVDSEEWKHMEWDEQLEEVKEALNDYFEEQVEMWEMQYSEEEIEEIFDFFPEIAQGVHKELRRGVGLED